MAKKVAKNTCGKCALKEWHTQSWNRAISDGHPLTLGCAHLEHGVLPNNPACEHFVEDNG